MSAVIAARSNRGEKFQSCLAGHRRPRFAFSRPGYRILVDAAARDARETAYAEVPADAGAMKRAATAISPVQEAQFYARPTRHGIIKCYREFVVGRPVCRHFHR